MSDLRSKVALFIADRNGSPRPRRDDHDETRYSDQQVEFHHEFTLGASGEVYPPGRYVIEIAEDSYAAAGRTAHVRKSTLLIVQTASGTRSVPINARELEAALIEDSRREKPDPEAGSTGTGNAKNPPTQSLQSEMERYGIERVPADVFLWRGYRYTHASDAIAAAKRGEKR